MCVIALAFGISQSSTAQILTLNPATATINDSITLTYNAALGNAALVGVSPVFAHIGIVLGSDTSRAWSNVQGTWGTNDSKVRMTSAGNNLWQLRFRIPRYFGVGTTANVRRLAMVFRNQTGTIGGRTATGGDIFVNIFQPGQFGLSITSPGGGNQLTRFGQQINIAAQTPAAANISILENDTEIGSVTSATSINLPYTINSYGKTRIKVIATNGLITVRDSFYCFTRPAVEIAEVPSGLQDGINYGADGTSATLVLYAPLKNHVFVLGEFNNWERTTEQYMKRTADGNRYWATITGLRPGVEYAFQYLVDSTIHVADPYCEIVLDENSDRYINQFTNTYPGLRGYPSNKAIGYCGILQTSVPAYNWKNVTFTRPAKSDLVIYELHIRDFVANKNYKTLLDSLRYLKRLGVNCIELMPINEFEGNDSWGYNPSFHYAIDKAYGTRNALRAFVDSCHSLGISVVADVVFNHAFSQSPLVQLWWDRTNNRPAANSPYLNPIAKHPFNVGYDFNHESTATQLYMDKCLKHYIQDFKIDGFRFDLSKGFTQVNSGDNVGMWGNYDASRIRLLKRMYDQVRTYDNSAYIILEHFAANNEEAELANYGMMLWGNMNKSYLQASMGYQTDASLSNSYFRNRGWATNNLVNFMESHDEERMMFKNINYGNISGNYNIKNLGTALDRAKLAAAFFFTVPGPKMMWQFGEVGYDYSINYCIQGDSNSSATGNCRTYPKPVRWNYQTQENRKKLFKVYAALINLKKDYIVFRDDNMDLYESGDLKRIKLSYGTEHAVIIGNFGVSGIGANPSFHQTGRWYNFFNGDSIEVTNQSALISLAPGEFRIYTTRRMQRPETNILVSPVADKILSNNSFKAGELYPNPSEDVLYLEFTTNKTEAISIELLNSLGQIVGTETISLDGAGTHVLNLNLARNVSKGQYLMKIKSSEGFAIRKFIKNK